MRKRHLIFAGLLIASAASGQNLQAIVGNVPPAGGGNNLALDGSAADSVAAASNPLTTSAGGEACVLAFADATTTAVTSASVTWTNKGTADNGGTYQISLWCGPHASALTSEVITQVAFGASAYRMLPFSFKNTNATPFDANGALPGLQTGGAGGHTTITTTSANDALLCLYLIVPPGSSAGSGFTQIDDGTGVMFAEYQLVTATQSGTTCTIGTGDGNNISGISQALVSN